MESKSQSPAYENQTYEMPQKEFAKTDQKNIINYISELNNMQRELSGKNYFNQQNKNYLDSLDTKLYMNDMNSDLLDKYMALVEDFMKSVKTNEFQENQIMGQLELLTQLGYAIFKNIQNYSMDTENGNSYSVKGTNYAKQSTGKGNYNSKLTGSNPAYKGNPGTAKNYSAQKSTSGYSKK